MATNPTLSPCIQATVNYVRPTPNGEALYVYVTAPPPMQQRSNLILDPHLVNVYNVRGREDDFSLDTTGFEFLYHTSIEDKFTDEAVIKTHYYREIEQLLKDHTGAKRVVALNHTVRYAIPRFKLSEYHVITTSCRHGHSEGQNNTCVQVPAVG